MAMQKFVLLAIAILLSPHVFSNLIETAEAIRDWIVLQDAERYALQSLLGAWNETTDNVNSSLPGWKTADPTNMSYDPCFFDPWRGVYCNIRKRENETVRGADVFDASVASIAVSDVSINGILPTSIWNFSNLLSLTLTGNPGLSGYIPTLSNSTRTTWTLKKLDLHGNGFVGPIPDAIGNVLVGLQDIDLSSNRLNGTFPSSFGTLSSLWTLKLSNNNLSGVIPVNISQNWTNLVTADLSSNRLSGHIPSMSNLSSLHTLNLSHNEFGGQIDLHVLNSGSMNSLAILDLSNNTFTGPMPNLRNWTSLQYLDLSNNAFDSGAFPDWVSNLKPSLKALGLKNTSLNGKLNLSMLKGFTKLRTLELGYNNITGAINLDQFPSQTRLHISLRNNQIREVIFSSLVKGLEMTLELQGNPYCSNETAETDNKKCFCDQECFDTLENLGKAKKKIILIASAVSGSVVAVIIGISAALFWKNKRDSKERLEEVQKKFAKHELKPTLFSYGELQKATNDFHPTMKVGEGGFGAVYKGKLGDESEVAVKQLNTNVQQSMDEFLNEVVVLTTVKHRNLVKLKGCCFHGGRRLLVYEYLDKYDLGEALFEHKCKEVITWPQRFNICLGVAHGLRYLHEGVEPRIIHRDIKANNVLLDKNLQPKIADFGLALLFPNDKTHITMMEVAGTKGYLAPEYASYGKLTEKVDVFSFGVLALEIVSGRRNIDLHVPMEKAYLTEWAWDLNGRGRLKDLVDSTLSIQIDEEPMVLRVMCVALSCLQTIADRRPTMNEVVTMLEGNIPVGEFARERPNENVNRPFYDVLGLSTLVTSHVPANDDSQVLYTRASSSGVDSSLELTSMKAR